MSLCVCKFPFQVPFRQRYILSGVEYSIRSLLGLSLSNAPIFISHFNKRYTLLGMCMCNMYAFAQSLYFHVLNACVNVTYALCKILFVFWLPAKIKNKHSAKSHFLDKNIRQMGLSERITTTKIHAPNQRKNARKEKLCFIGNLKPVT